MIARELDIIEIRTAVLSSFEGALLTTPERTAGAILVNERSSPQRQRFTIAHELLHFLNDRHVQTADGFSCRAKDIGRPKETPDRAGTTHLRQEAEANRFAIELLAPRSRFQRILIDGPDLGAVRELAKDLEVSREAIARRYVDLRDDPIAIAFSKDGKLRYTVRGAGFPALSLRKGDPIRIEADRRLYGLTGIADADPTEWLRAPSMPDLAVQTLYQHDGYAMHLLIAGTDIDAHEEGESGLPDLAEDWPRWG